MKCQSLFPEKNKTIIPKCRLIAARSDNILYLILIAKYFLRPLIHEEQLSVSGERMCTSTG